MEQTVLRSLYYNLSKLMSSELVERILNFLYNTQTLTQFECSAIREKPVAWQKASELVLTVWRKGNRACIKFFQALEDCDPILSAKLTGRSAKMPTVSAAVTVGCNSLPITCQAAEPVAISRRSVVPTTASQANSAAKPVTVSRHSGVHTVASQGTEPATAAPSHCVAPTTVSQVPSPLPTPFATTLPASFQAAIQSSFPSIHVYIMNATMTNCIIGNGSQLQKTCDSVNQQQWCKKTHGKEETPPPFENPAALSDHMDAIQSSVHNETVDLKIINSDVQCMIAGKGSIMRIEEEVGDEESDSEDDNLDIPTEEPS